MVTLAVSVPTRTTAVRSRFKIHASSPIPGNGRPKRRAGPELRPPSAPLATVTLAVTPSPRYTTAELAGIVTLLLRTGRPSTSLISSAVSSRPAAGSHGWPAGSPTTMPSRSTVTRPPAQVPPAGPGRSPAAGPARSPATSPTRVPGAAVRHPAGDRLAVELDHGRLGCSLNQRADAAHGASDPARQERERQQDAGRVRQEGRRQGKERDPGT